MEKPRRLRNRIVCSRFLEPIGNRAAQFFRQNRGCLFLPPFLPQIDDADERHLALSSTRWVSVRAVDTCRASRCDSSRAKAWRVPRSDDAFLDLAANDRDIARVIARRFLLFVGGLVFFIDDDEPEIFERRENRAARADHDPRAAGMDLVPFIVPLAFRQMAVQDGDVVRLLGEAALETLDGLRRERDFRNEHDRRLAARERGADRLQINFRFAAAGHAVEQNRRGAFRRLSSAFSTNFRAAVCSSFSARFGVGDELLVAHADRAPRLARATRRIRALRARGASGYRAKSGAGDRPPASARSIARSLPAIRPAAARACAISQSPPGSISRAGLNEKLFLPADFRASDHLRQQAAHDRFNRAAVVVAHPARELDQRSAQDRAFADDASIGWIPFAWLLFEQSRRPWRARFVAKGNAHARADADSLGQALGHGIIELAMDRAIDDDADEAWPLPCAAQPNLRVLMLVLGN